MRTIERSTAFKRDYKRTKSTPRYSKNLNKWVSNILSLLLADQALPENNRDHPLGGNWEGYRE